MKIVQGLDITTEEFFYDLFDGGYIKPEMFCENENDAKKIRKAMKIIEDFKDSCEEQIEDFIQ